MHLGLKTLLNRVERLKGFVYESSSLIEGHVPRIEIQLRARERSRGACSQCQKPAPGYDRLAERQFQFVPLWGIPTYFRYAPRRVRCREHGIVVEHLPWALGKRPLTASFAWFLASWAKLLSWQDVSRTFKTSWESVFRSVEMAVDWGRARMDLTGISAAGSMRSTGARAASSPWSTRSTRG
ncbi:transposase IS204/IS1001/IS1096/IS1165 family protein [mine drainage metagenome]|uniref:Transposase IS204/IS1001/IS1096/IS1165 family protein n=1 Tax=mine drainage metagenome TaxID=410659 RepID=T0ZVU2_9ZZZZ